MRALKFGLIALSLVALGAGTAWGYPSAGNCTGCHTEFGGIGAATHELHNTFVNGCTYCHTSIGDTPQTSSSGSDPNNGCSGCHSGGGTAQHHITTGASGCNCHSSTTSWPRGTESTEGPYYDTAATSLRFACFDGLDNDGDNIYDGNDPDCIGVPNDERSWSVIKQIYGDE